MQPKVQLDKKENKAIDVYALSHDGRGIATIEDKKTFVSGALPNEKVTCRITQKKSSFYEAQLLNVIQATSERATPPCQHFGVCGGCSLQHMSTALQLTFKQNTLLEQLKHFGKVAPNEILPPLQAETLGYRRKARLGVKFVIKKNKLLVGFREKSSRYLADLEKCVVLHPSVGERFAELSTLIASLSCYSEIAQIEVAIGDIDVALVFRHLVNLTEDDREKLIAFGKQYQFQIYLQPNAPALIEKLWPEDNHPRLAYSLPAFDLEFLFHPLDFTQVNLTMNRLMVNQAIQLLDIGTSDRVLDLFCGIGNFSLPIARRAKEVVGVEGSAEMVKRASENALHNGILNASFYVTNLEEMARASFPQTSYDKILLDPPRVGAAGILPSLAKFYAKKIVYISCNPATLARDAGELVHKLGYTLTHAGIMNMFPHTAHIEAIAVFQQ